MSGFWMVPKGEEIQNEQGSMNEKEEAEEKRRGKERE